MSSILSVGSMPSQDTSITKKQYHSYSPYTSSYGPNDEVRIAIQSQDLYVLPSESYILLEANVVRRDGANHAAVEGRWAMNAESYFFSEIRYEINNVEIDRIKNPGLTSTIKRSAAYPSSVERALNESYRRAHQTITLGSHQFLIPLHDLFGFCDDYQKIIMNVKHELILVVNRQFIYAYNAPTDSFNITITKIQWKIPHIQLADHSKLQMLRYLERKQVIGVPFRSWDLYEMPELPRTTKHIWTVKSTTQISKPRFVFVVLQTNKQLVNVNSELFDHCNIRDIRLYLNNEYFPYDSITSDFTNGNYSELFRSFCAIQKAYYPEESENPMGYTYANYGTYPIWAFDCSRTDESMLAGTVDIRLEFNARQNIPAHTAANCLIIYDDYFEYSPFSSIVVKRT